MANVPNIVVSVSAAPGQALVKVTKADNYLPNGPCRSLHVGTAGTANLIDASGNVLTDFPLVQGLNPYGFRQVSTGGTADDIWAVY